MTLASGSELVHYEVADGVATLTLDSPHNRNALSRQLVSELDAQLTRAAKDDTPHVVVLRSSHRVFCSGADLTEAAEGSMSTGARALVDLQRRLLTHPLPIVTRLAGPARAGGLGIVAASDIVVCSDDATFAFNEARLALAPAVISLSVLPRLSSRAAFETFLTGREFSAAEAVTMGLVTTSVPPEKLDAQVAATCKELLAAHPQGLRATKALLVRGILDHLEDNAEDMIEVSARLFGSEAARSAMLAFRSRAI